MYTHLELHLAAVPLSRKHAKAVKAVNGKPGSARSSRSARFVTLPATERALIDELVRTYAYAGKKGTTTIVARGGTYGEPAWVSVQYVAPIGEGEAGPSAQFERAYTKAHAQAVERGILRSVEQVAWDQMHAEATAENGRRDRALHREVMIAALAIYLDLGKPNTEQAAMALKHLQQYQDWRFL